MAQAPPSVGKGGWESWRRLYRLCLVEAHAQEFGQDPDTWLYNSRAIVARNFVDFHPSSSQFAPTQLGVMTISRWLFAGPKKHHLTRIALRDIGACGQAVGLLNLSEGARQIASPLHIPRFLQNVGQPFLR